MGAYSPAPVLTPRCRREAMRTHHQADRRGDGGARHALHGRALCGADDHEGRRPKLIEYNCRFGDPECQVLMMRLKSDLVTALLAARDGSLHHLDLRWRDEVALTVVMAAKGYPGDYEKGSEIRGLERRARVEGVADLPCRHRAARWQARRQRRARAERHGTGRGRRRGAGARLSRRRSDRLAGRLSAAATSAGGPSTARLGPRASIQNRAKYRE